MSKKPICLVTADCHLQERAWVGYSRLEYDAFWAFEWIVGYAIQQKIPAIVAAGDVIDAPENEAKLVAFLSEQMRLCEESEVKFYYIQGQHDMQEPTPWLTAIHHWPEWLAEDNYFFFGDHRVQGIDWTHREELEEQLSLLDRDVEILVMHQVSELMGSIVTPELRWRQIPPHVKMLIIGDYHKHLCAEQHRDGGGMLTVVSPGSTAMQEISEESRKRVFVLYDDLSTESVDIPGRIALAPPTIHTDGDLDKFVEKVGEQIKKARGKAAIWNLPDELETPILRVKYQDNLIDPYRRIRKAVGDQAHLFVKALQVETEEKRQSVQEAEEVVEAGLLGALPQVAEEGTQRFSIADRLLRAPNKVAALAEIRREYLGDDDA